MVAGGPAEVEEIIKVVADHEIEPNERTNECDPKTQAAATQKLSKPETGQIYTPSSAQTGSFQSENAELNISSVDLRSYTRG